jgi:hypothetical protein
MDRQNDPKISDDVILFRRIPPWPDNVHWDEQGRPTPSTLNFKDATQELSVNIASETTAEEVLTGHLHFGLVQIGVFQVREACGPGIIICRCLEEPAMGHALICGKISGGAAKKLQRAVKWVEGRWPTRNPPELY